MHANMYQKLAARTLNDGPGFEISQEQWAMIATALTLAAMAGKNIEKIKKGVFHQHGLETRDLAASLSDMALAISNIAQLLITVSSSEDLPELDDRDTMIIWNILGLAGEAGEIATLGLALLQDQSLDEAALVDELGDSAWYNAALASKLNKSWAEVLQQNIDKLVVRYKDGFTPEESINR